jgi:hypothetical protein
LNEFQPDEYAHIFTTYIYARRLRHQAQRHNMRVAKMCRYRILSALIAAVMISYLPVFAVVWQYEDNSNSESQLSQTSLSPAAMASNAQTTAQSTNSSSSTNGDIWSWGGTPRGFSTSNGILKYPLNYYTSRFKLGYNNSVSPYGQNNLQNLSHYSAGFTTGYLPGYDPNYPYEYTSS